MNYYDPAF